MSKLNILSATLILITNISIAQDKMIDKTVVKDLDLNKYMGTWYEIARFDHFFERDLVGVTASYSFRDDGLIEVINRGFEDSLDGERTEAIGKVKIPDPTEPTKLKVSFFWIFYSDYFIMELDKDYQWAVIGSSSDSYLWILSRTPQIAEELYTSLLKGLRKRGYDTNQLIKVKQKEL